jgi:hypothetical protein
MVESNRDENLDAEGIPEVDEMPPGRNIDTNEEALMAPRDHSIAAGSDPAYAVTAREGRLPESVADRAARENPEFGERDLYQADQKAEAGRLLDPDSDIDEIDVTAEEIGLSAEDDSAGMSAEESAVHLVSEDVADDLDPATEREQYTGDR